MMDNTDVRRALAQGEFVPYFQPLVVIRTGQLAGFEVLARWNHPVAGLVLPGDFIPLAEKDGWIGELTQQIFRKAFAAAASLPGSLSLAANISPVQLRDLTLAKQIRSAAEQASYSLDRLMVEITESALTDNLEHALIIANELKSMGCRLALDDFGTGYSSLLHLQSMPFDELKVDRSFVSSMTVRRESRKIVGAVIGLGQNLGLTTVAEGIEEEEQAELLRWLGCDLGQGWLYGRPMPAEELASFVAKPRRHAATDVSTPWKATSLDDLNGLPAQRLAQLQAVYDGAPVGLAFLNRHFRYVNLNQRLADMNGMRVEEHLGRSVTEVVPALFKQFEPYLRRALAGESITDVEVTKPAAGEADSVTLLLSYQPVRDEAEEVIGISIAIVDITARKKVEEALRESEDHYRHMVELNPQIPWIMDADGQNVEVSPKWEQATGLSREQTRGTGWLDVLHPDDRDRVVTIIENALRSGRPMDMEYRVQHPEGGWRWMRSRGSPRFDASGIITRWYGSAEDIDEWKRTEDSLRASEARLQAVFDSVPVAIILADAPDGALRMANPEARRLFRGPILPGPSMKNYSQWHAVKANGDPMQSDEYPLARALRGETTHEEELLCQFADGSTLWIAFSGAPIYGRDGLISGGVVVAQDIDAARRGRAQKN